MGIGSSGTAVDKTQRNLLGNSADDGNQSNLRRSTSADSQSSETYDFSEDVLIHVLSFVPAGDLLNSCCYVCCQWNSLISGNTIWKRKCERERKVVPKYNFKSIPKNYYRNIYLRNPYGRNLLRNNCGRDGTDYWINESVGGEGWTVEDKPVGADPVPDEAGCQSCYATSYGNCQKHQVIDLVKEGVNEEILNEVCPNIEVGEWHAARFDCGSIYNLKVVLLDASHKEIDGFKYGPFKETQWAGRAWTKVEYVFTGYPRGVRYISFEHSGQDTQFWAGHYGSKMTGGYVKFVWKD